jgi:two-component sensor histidine kinase
MLRILSLIRSALLVLILIFPSIAIQAQSMSDQEAGTLLRTLPNSKGDTVQIDILLKLAKYQVLKPGEKKSDLDSAADFIKKAENINAKIKSKWAEGYILLVKSNLLRESGKADEGKESARKAVDILKTQTDKLLIGQAYFDYASYFDMWDTELLKDRIRLVDTAVSYFKQSGNLEKLGESLYMLGDLHQIDGSNFICLQKLQLSLDAYASIHHEAVQGIYSLMGKIYLRERDYKNAFNYNLLALKTAEKVGDSSIQMCMINNDIGSTLSQMGEMEKAISYYNGALEIAEKYKDDRAVYISALNIANAWNSLDQPLKALNILNTLAKKYDKPKDLGVDYNLARAYIGSYCILKQYYKAEPYCDQLLTMVRTLNLNDYSNLYAYAEVVKFYIKAGKYNLAAKYLSLHKALAEKISDLLQMANSYQLWFMLDTAQHNYRAAVDHLITYKKLNDSLFNETKSEQIAELQVVYETEKKEKDIQVKNQNIQILTKQDELEKNKLQQGAILRNISFAFAALLIIVMVLLYSRYRLKQRTNRKLELQQGEITKQNEFLQHLVNEKDWLVKEIHHRVKNNLQIVMSLLNSQSAYIDNESALTAIHDSQNRVHAMSLIHQKLYNTDNFSSIDMSLYIRELVSYLAESFETAQRIRFELQLASIEMDVSEAVPLGLILNEAITNSIKYAFPGSRDGVISISLSNIDSDHCLLIISDNGIGISLESNNKKPGSLGMSLIQGLSEDLEGKFSIESKNGTTIKISFVHDIGVNKYNTGSALLVSNN